MKNELQTLSGQTGGIFSDIKAFENAQRTAKVLVQSDLVPQQYRGNMSNCLIALDLANRMGASPLVIMQNLDVIRGRPSFSGKFLISALKNSSKFKNVRPVYFGKRGTDSYGCMFLAEDTVNNVEIEGPEVTIGMAKSEGWFSKKDKNGRETSKWPTMPQLMLAYRAGTFFSRIHAPELTMGLPTQEEAYDAPVTEDAKHEEVRDLNEKIYGKTDNNGNNGKSDNDLKPEPKTDPEPEPSKSQEKPTVKFDDDEVAE